MERREEAELLRDAIAGDESALKALYRKHRRAVFAQAFTVSGSRPDAEEVLQDTFVLLWQKRKHIRLVGSSVLPWLLVTTRNLARNARRRSNVRAAVVLEIDPESAGSSPEEVRAKRELANVLAESVRRLDPLDRRILELCLEDALSYKEAAHVLRLSHASIRNRLSRARQSLRTTLGHALEEKGL